MSELSSDEEEMSRKRASPVSENTLIRNVVASGMEYIGDLSDSFLSNISDSDQSDDTDSEILPGYDDDTDNDPNWELSEEPSSDDEHPVSNQISSRRGRNSLSIDETIADVIAGSGRPNDLPSTSSCVVEASDNLPELGHVNNNVNMPILNTVQNTIEDVIRNAQYLEMPVLNQDIPPDLDPNNPDYMEWTPANENDPGFDHNIGFFEQPGPKHCPPHDAKPIEYFFLFFTIHILTKFVSETNRYATQYIATHAHRFSPHSRARQWRSVTLGEMRAFIAVIMNMGLNRKPNLQSYWATSDSQHCPWYGKMFSRARFESILQFFHMVDNSKLAKVGEPGYDPCAKFLPLLETVNRLFRLYYTPHRELSIDESLVGTKSHSQLLQYLPNKHHHKWGVKMWMLCDSVSRYCLAFYCYKGSKKSGEITKGLAFKVVKKLLEIGQYLNKGYHVFIDNFFTSIPLATYLYENLTFVTGTVRKNRKGIPPQLKEKFQVGQKTYVRNDSLLFLGYREKQSQKNPVLLLSTKHTAKSTQKIIKRKNQEDRVKEIPEMIDSYNHFMGGVDGSDQMIYCYLDERRTLKYWKKVTFNIFARMILNAYIIYSENTSGKVLSRYNFTVSIVEDLSKQWLIEKNAGHQGDGDGPNVNLLIGLSNLPGKQGTVVSAAQSAPEEEERKKS
uniref:PiggyBac transposable element-derived protein domain-containing protein n=1 Tax=Cuerna arida TaxID=1464854 RepID=A0A1B6H1M9_9HEMI